MREIVSRQGCGITDREYPDRLDECHCRSLSDPEGAASCFMLGLISRGPPAHPCFPQGQKAHGLALILPCAYLGAPVLETGAPQPSSSPSPQGPGGGPAAIKSNCKVGFRVLDAIASFVPSSHPLVVLGPLS